MDVRECPKCGGGMAEGFIVDVAAGGAAVVSKWQGGEPHKGRFFGVSQRGAEQIDIITFRCADCGYLESYAPGGTAD